MSSYRKSCSAFPSECISLKEHKAINNLQYFPFPTGQYLFEQWAKASKRTDLLRNGALYAHNNAQLCELHFSAEFFKADRYYKTLKKNAIPSVFGAAKCRENIDRNIIVHNDDDDDDDYDHEDKPEEIEEILLEVKTELPDSKDQLLTELLIEPAIPGDFQHEATTANVPTPQAKPNKKPRTSNTTGSTPKAATQTKTSFADLLRLNYQLREIIKKNEATIDSLRNEYKLTQAEMRKYKERLANEFDDE